MRRTKMGLALFALFACSQPQASDAGRAYDGSADAQAIADSGSDAHVRIDGAQCPAGTYETSSFGNACFGD
jgi:hypothetical protein